MMLESQKAMAPNPNATVVAWCVPMAVPTGSIAREIPTLRFRSSLALASASEDVLPKAKGTELDKETEEEFSLPANFGRLLDEQDEAVRRKHAHNDPRGSANGP